MKVKTSDLNGPLLDWAVDECEIRRMQAEGEYVKQWVIDYHNKGEVSITGASTGKSKRSWLDFNTTTADPQPPFRAVGDFSKSILSGGPHGSRHVRVRACRQPAQR